MTQTFYYDGMALKNIAWTDYGRDWRNFSWKDGLAQPGVQIEVEGERFLIGHINGLGGVCDDCTAFDPQSIVARYRVVLVFDDETPDA